MKPTILLVEDDEILRYLTREALTMMDMDVIEARTADDAFTTLIQNPVINLVFTDVRMPGQMDGLDLARLVWRAWPALPVIVTSGHRSMTKAQLPAIGAFLAKPWTLEQFGELITSQLQHASGSATGHSVAAFSDN